MPRSEGARAARRVLELIPGVELAPLNESDMCCGSAGMYNLTHNERSMLILDRKMANIEATDADVSLAGNPAACCNSIMAGALYARINLCFTRCRCSTPPTGLTGCSRGAQRTSRV